MANILRQTVFQINVETEKRIIVQYINESGDDVQTINNYDNLTENEKLIFSNKLLDFS